MSEQEAKQSPVPAPMNIPIEWSDISTVLVDQIVGFTNADGIGRVAFGQLTFRPGIGTPVARPVAMLASTVAGWRRIRTQIDQLIETAEKQGSAQIGDPEVLKNG